jgi:uncharacterized membrane protein YeaQ/YmgE (transglycosylase-associated protein family)
MTIRVETLVVWIIIGGLAGYAAGSLLRRGSFGIVGNIIVGIIGALLGGFLFNVLNININLPDVNLGDLVVAFIGAVIVVLLLGLVGRRR